MARWRGSGRETTADYFRIDMRKLKRQFLVPGTVSTVIRRNWDGDIIGAAAILAEAGQIVLFCKIRDEQTTLEYPVRLDWTPCHFGGRRPWFLCPNCSRRVAVLYSMTAFICRRCLGLAYESQRESPCDRALRRAQAIRERLGGSGSMAEPFPLKPRGMLIVLDYLQIFDGEEREIRTRVGAVSNTLRSLAKTEQVSVVALSQLRRPQDENERPTMFHLKESGDIEAHAHTICLIYRPKDEQGRWSGCDEIIVAKQREGLVGLEPVLLDAHRLWFVPRTGKQ